MSDTQQIQAYEARMRWSTLLDEVNSGATYIVFKRRQAVAALVPLEPWQQQIDNESAEAGELAQLVEQFESRHAKTMAQLDNAFAELASTRKALAKSRIERETARFIPRTGLIVI